MLRCYGGFITRELYIEVRIVIDIKSIPVYEKEGIEASVSYIGGASLVIEVYRCVDSADDLKITYIELIQLVFIVLIAELNVVSYLKALIRDAVGVDDTLIHVLRQSALNEIQFVYLSRKRDGL